MAEGVPHGQVAVPDDCAATATSGAVADRVAGQLLAHRTGRALLPRALFSLGPQRETACSL